MVVLHKNVTVVTALRKLFLGLSEHKKNTTILFESFSLPEVFVGNVVCAEKQLSRVISAFSPILI
jgi:hypothetical protein